MLSRKLKTFQIVQQNFQYYTKVNKCKTLLLNINLKHFFLTLNN